MQGKADAERSTNLTFDHQFSDIIADPPNPPAFGVKFPLFCCYYAITIFYLIIPLNWHFHYHTYIAQFHRDIDIRNTIETFSFAILYVLHWCMSGARAPVLCMQYMPTRTHRDHRSLHSLVYMLEIQWPRWSTTQFYQAASCHQAHVHTAKSPRILWEFMPSLCCLLDIYRLDFHGSNFGLKTVFWMSAILCLS